MNAPRPAILVVDDDAALRRVLVTGLGAQGYRVVESASGKRGAIDARSHAPDLAIVDLGLPDADGIDIVRSIRSWSPMPIIVLSARVQERTKIDALDAGADDYVTKPFGMGELVARVRVALRNAVRSRSGARRVEIGPIVLDLDRRVASKGGREIHLTANEFRLLAVLARHLGLVVMHTELLREVWGPSHERDTHYLRIYMKQLRDKLDDPVRPRHFLTEPGIGYRLVE